MATQGKKPSLALASSAPPATLVDRSDDDLMTLCATGYEPALAQLIERYESRLFGLAIKYLGSAPLAEDATQSAFVSLWDLRTRYQPRGRFAAYILRLCLNRCRLIARSRRRRNRALDRFGEEPRPSVMSAGEDELIRWERRREVERAIAKLSVKLREAVLLRFYSDLSYSEMSDILGSSEVALRSRVHKALARLRKNLSNEALYDLS